MGVMTRTHVKTSAARCQPDMKLHVFIDGSGTIYAEDEEHVGKKGSKVNFFAAAPCTVHFDNVNVFSMSETQLGLGNNVLTTTGDGKTKYFTHEPAIGGGDPILVVP